VKRPQFGGRKLGPSGWNGAGAAHDARLQPITSSSPPLFSFAQNALISNRQLGQHLCLSDQAPAASHVLASIDPPTEPAPAAFARVVYLPQGMIAHAQSS
jgi:hypothetical protein